MAQQIVKKTRHLQKHDIEANWLKAVNFKPMLGEIIVYDKDEKHDFVRTKIGDGETNINDLPFVKNAIIDVASLPTENINQEAIYRVFDTVVYDYGNPLYEPKINYVDTLPEEGENIIDFETGDLCFYYKISDGLIHCYVNEELSAAAGAEGKDLSEGWYSYQDFLRINGNPDFGIVILPVTELPTSGMPALMINEDSDMPYNNDIWGYYSQNENEVYCYVDDKLSAFINNGLGQFIPEGWYLFSQLAPMNNIDYQGIFFKEQNIPFNGVSILINNILYTYNNQWESIQKEQEIIQSDWLQNDETQPDYIQNKPITDDGKIYPALLYQPDWQQTNQYAVDYIKNKPAEIVEDGKIKPDYLYQPDWDVYDESKFSAIKNRPVYTVSAGTVFYEGEAINYSEDGWSETPFTLNWLDTNVKYNIEWGDLQFQNIKLTLKDSVYYIDDNCYIYIGHGINSSGIHDHLGRVPAGSVRLKITASQDYIKKLDEKYLPLLVGKRDISKNAEIFNNYVNNVASGNYSHAEGSSTSASGSSSHAEGSSTIASGNYSHAEGNGTRASGNYSHAEGSSTSASGSSSHAEGGGTSASGSSSHAEGSSSHAAGRSQHVQGEYNIIDPLYDVNNPNVRGKYSHIVGNGTNINNLSNAHTLDWDGNAWFQGNVYVGGTGQDDTVAKRLLTEDDLQDCSLPKTTTADNGKLLQVVNGEWNAANVEMNISFTDDGEGNVKIESGKIDTGTGDGDTTNPYTDYQPDVPENIGVLNTILNFKQIAEINYTALRDLPRNSVNPNTGEPNPWPMNTKIKGLPYSSSRVEEGFVPNFVSLETFMTALQNPNSYIYTKNLLTDYNNQNGQTYYGTVCSVACAYALNIVPNYTTHQWQDVPGMEYVPWQSVYALKLGDTICHHTSGHVVMVTDITRNKRGKIGHITTTEAAGTNVKVTKYTPEEFEKKYPIDTYAYHRYSKIHEVQHMQSDFVAVEDETPKEFTYNRALIPRKGDKANWLQGETVEIDLLEKSGYTKVEVYKNNDDMPFKSELIGGGEVTSVDRTVHGLLWKFGSLSNSEATNRIRTTFFALADVEITAQQGAQFQVWFYGEDSTQYVDYTKTFVDGSVTLNEIAPENATSALILAKYSDDRVIDNVDYLASMISVRMSDTATAISLPVEISTISSTNGENTSSLRSDRARTGFIPLQNLLIDAESDVEYNILYYNADKEYLGRRQTDWITEPVYVMDGKPEGAAYFRLVIRDPNDAIISQKLGVFSNKLPATIISSVSEGGLDVLVLNNLGYGSYKARLTDDANNNSDWCYWIVVDAVSSAMATDNPREVSVTFSASNAEPLFIKWAGGNPSDHGYHGTKHINVLTPAQIAAKEAIVKYETAFDDKSNGKYKLRVAFQTEYGIIHTPLGETITVK